MSCMGYLRRVLGNAGLWMIAGSLAITVLLGAVAQAAPVTYTAFTITDGQLGRWHFHNARVILRFDSDTNNVQFLQIPDPVDPTNPLADIAINTVGTASVTIATAQRRVHATFAPNQIFVSIDRGSLDGSVLVGGRGVGFGSFSATAPGGLEVSYPFGIEDGTIDWGDAALPSPALGDLALDLQNSSAFSGRAWICLGFPDQTCPTPTQGLHTDHGDLLLFQPYMNTFAGDTLQGGFFTTDVGGTRNVTLTPPASARGAKPITYNGYLLTDVRLGGQSFSHAQVYLSFEGDAANVVPFNDGASSGYINSSGRAQVTIISGLRMITAAFAPGQLYVYYDVVHGSIGFGSNAGGRGYPLSLTADQDSPGLVENSSLFAITDILTTPSNAVNYSPATPNLETDLTNATALSGGASSCVAFDPVTSICSNLNPIPLRTSRGNLYLFEPYTDDETTTTGAAPFTVNWGMFWADLGTNNNDD
jgi:hypothetical protein